jgi:hypothetical protein
MSRVQKNRPPFQQLDQAQARRAAKLAKGAMPAPPPPPSDPKKAAALAKRAAAFEPLQLTEKIFVGARPERAYFAAIAPENRSVWDKNAPRVRFVRPRKGEPIPSKAAEGALIEMVMPLRLGGLFQLQYMLIQQPRGFALQAVRGSFGVLAGLAETWAFEPFKGGTQVTYVRTAVPRFRWLKNYVERNQTKALKQTLEGLKKYIEETAK